MRRFVAASLIATLLMVATPDISEAATSHNGRYHARCAGKRVRWLRPALGVAVIERRVLKLLIPCVYRRWGPPSGIALSTVQCIANRESHGYPYARNPSGSSGVFQQVNWDQRAEVWLRKRWFPGHGLTPKWSFVRGPDGWTDARANTIMSIQMMDSVGLSPWGGSC